MRRETASSFAFAPVFFSSGAAHSVVHLRGGIGIGCGEKDTRYILEIPRSGVRLTQISQAGAGDSVWAAQNLSDEETKNAHRAASAGCAVRMAEQFKEKLYSRSASV